MAFRIQKTYKTYFGTKMKNVSILFVLTLLVFASCVSTKKYTAFTKEKILTISSAPNKNISANIQIKIDSLKAQDSLVRVEKLKSFIVPALVYWQTENTLKCSLSPTIMADWLYQDINHFADSINLWPKLQGKNIELSLLQIPNSFIYSRKQTLILFLFFGYASKGLEAIYPDSRAFKANYKITEQNKEIKTGTLLLPNKVGLITNKTKITKLFTWAYLEQYRKSCNKLHQELLITLLSLL